jgi:hypothetical protein
MYRTLSRTIAPRIAPSATASVYAQRVAINGGSLVRGSIRRQDCGDLRRCMRAVSTSITRGALVASRATTTSTGSGACVVSRAATTASTTPKSWIPRMLWRMVWIPYATLALIPLTTGMISMYHYSGATRELC